MIVDVVLLVAVGAIAGATVAHFRTIDGSLSRPAEASSSVISYQGQQTIRLEIDITSVRHGRECPEKHNDGEREHR